MELISESSTTLVSEKTPMLKNETSELKILRKQIKSLTFVRKLIHVNGFIFKSRYRCHSMVNKKPSRGCVQILALARIRGL